MTEPKMSRRLNFDRLAEAAAAYTAQEAKRKPVHPYTLEASLLDIAAAAREILEAATEPTGLARRQRVELEVESHQRSVFAQSHGISPEEAKATEEAAILLGIPLASCDPHDPDIRRYRLFDQLTLRYAKLVRQRNRRRPKVILEGMRRRLTRTLAANSKLSQLYAPFAVWLLAETIPTKKSRRGQPKTETDPHLVDAIKTACEFVRLADLGNISDSSSHKTVCHHFNIHKKTLQTWMANHRDSRGTLAMRVFSLAPDPYSHLVAASAAYRAIQEI
jgi:hypothetical protein